MLTITDSDVWIKELRRLESDVPPRDTLAVYQTIKEELCGMEVEDVFEWFDPEPLGSASIGQVHRARLRGGKEVAVKVQYNEVGSLFRYDMKAIRKFCEVLAPENVISLNALEQQNAMELDYCSEASNLKEVHRNMERHGFTPSEVRVPLPIDGLSTKRMLVMELLPGPKLSDGVRAYFAKWAKENGTSLEELEAKSRIKIEEEGIPARYNGPSANQIEWVKKYSSFRNKFVNSGVALYNTTVGKIRGVEKLPYRQNDVLLNLPQLVDVLMRVHGRQLLQDGCFNTDPHGGNFLLLPDGKIGLIDYGATKHLSRNERLSACLIFAALHRNDENFLYELCVSGGYKSKHGRKDVLMKLMKFAYDTYGNDLMKGKNVQQFMDELKAADPYEEASDNLVMASFMSIRLRSLALGMNHPVRCSDWWGPMAEEILINEGLPYESWDRDLLNKYRPELNMQKYKFG